MPLYLPGDSFSCVRPFSLRSQWLFALGDFKWKNSFWDSLCSWCLTRSRLLPLLSFLVLHLTSAFLWNAHIIIYTRNASREIVNTAMSFLCAGIMRRKQEKTEFLLQTMLFIHVIHYARVRRPAAEFECVNGENQLIIETTEPLLVALNCA